MKPREVSADELVQRLSRKYDRWIESTDPKGCFDEQLLDEISDIIEKEPTEIAAQSILNLIHDTRYEW